jgi:hypothetical protein
MAARKVLHTSMFFCLLFLASVCWGQTMDNDSSVSGSGTFVDNFANLNNAAYNLWHNTNAALVQVSTAEDGTTVGVDSSHCMWTFPSDYPTHKTWVKDPSNWCHMLRVYSMDATHLFGIYDTNLGVCQAGFYSFMAYNQPGHPGWNAWGGACVSPDSVSVSPDGMVCAFHGYPLVPSGNAQRLACLNGLYGVGGFTLVSGVPPSYYMSAVVNKNLVYIAQYAYQGACVLSGPLTSMTCTFNHFLDEMTGVTTLVANQNEVWALGPIVSGGNVYRNDGINGWKRVYGLVANTLSVNDIKVGGIWASTANGAVWRASLLAWQATGTYTSHTICHAYNGLQIPCSQINPSNPPIHTPNITCCFTGGKHIGGGTIAGSGASPDTVNHVSLGDTCGDPLALFELSPVDCALDAGSGGWTKCTMLGAILQMAAGGIIGGLKPIATGLFHVTHEMVPNPQVGHNCAAVRFGVTNCGYYVLAQCPNAPPYAFTDREIRYFKSITELPAFWGWDSVDECIKFKNNTYTCFPAWASPLGGDPRTICATPADVLALH